MLIQGSRPRVLAWFHAGPMLFGDWGTSRLYVLGLAFSFAGHASIWYMAAMSVLLVAVAWAYEVICRNFPCGGGVYSAAKEQSKLLAVVGGLLLCADYVVTAALSALDAFHYVHVSRPELWAAGSIIAIGCINYFGPSKAGTMALIAAVATVGFTLIIGVSSAPDLSHAVVERAPGTPGVWWSKFIAIILAISGVEAIANMTGIMKEPVARTARLSIWPVVIEIVVLNLVLTLAMQAVPLEVLGDGDPSQATTAHRDDMLKVLASHYVGPTFAAVASLVFAALLLSAVNTAVTDLVSIQFMLARDRELPGAFGGLNRFGMPAAPLVLATLVPAATVVLAPDVGVLAELYAIGVVGAIAINLTACATNRHLQIRTGERIGMAVLATFMLAVWGTIAWEKPRALAFAGGIVGIGLVGRALAKNSARIGAWMLAPVKIGWVPAPIAVSPAPEIASSAPAAVAQPRPALREKLLVATRGNPKLLEFAFRHAQDRHAEMLVLFVRHIALMVDGARPQDLEADVEATRLAGAVAEAGRIAGVPTHFLYAVASDVADAVLDTAVTHGVDTVLIGATRRGPFWRALKGDVIQELGQHLPENVKLLIHA